MITEIVIYSDTHEPDWWWEIVTNLCQTDLTGYEISSCINNPDSTPSTRIEIRPKIVSGERTTPK